MMPVRNYLLLTCLFFISLYAAGQQYTIRYASGPVYYDSTKPPPETRKSVLVIRDSLSYYYQVFDGKDSVPSIPLGRKFRGHTTFIDHAKKLLLFQSDPMGYPKFLVEDTIGMPVWQTEEADISIAGFPCKKATAQLGNKMEVMVFYSTKLPAGYGPLGVSGLPGTILEVWWKGSTNVLSAVSVEPRADPIVEPDDGKRISREEFDKKIRRLHSGRGQGVKVTIQ